MIYLLEFVKGILIALGIMAGFIGGVALLVYKMKGSMDEHYEAEDLITPFEKYLKKVKDDEAYEQINELEMLIAKLREGVLPDAVRSYKIKKDVNVILKNGEGENTFVKFVTTYVVMKKLQPKNIKQ